jgi:hypothetical protein
VKINSNLPTVAALIEDYNPEIGSVKSGSPWLLEMIIQNIHAMSKN